MEIRKNEIIRKEYVETYIATDGTEFGDKDECLKYEKSAWGVLKGRLAKMALKRASECDLFNGAGCDENSDFVVVPRSEAEVAVLQQIAYMKAYNDDHKKKYAEMCEVGKVLIVTVAYDDDSVWFTDFAKVVEFATEGKYELTEKK